MSQWLKKPGYIQQRRQAARLKQKRVADQRHLSSVDRIADALESTKTQEQTDDDNRAFREKLTIGLLVFTVLFTGGADGIFYATLRDAHKASREQLRRLDHQLGLMADSSRQTDTQISVTKDLASAAKDQADAARQGIIAARDNIIAGSRAWVGPNGATIEAAPVAGNPVTLLIAYQNTGRQPATGFVSSFDQFVITLDEDKMGVTAAKLTKNLVECKAKQPTPGVQVVYPSIGFASTNSGINIDKSLIDDKVVSGDKIIGVTGCFAYETFGTPITAHSAFSIGQGHRKSRTSITARAVPTPIDTATIRNAPISARRAAFLIH
jgi:hypothetical protein